MAEFRFQPGFNLIAGVNGVGKTTVLRYFELFAFPPSSGTPTVAPRYGQGPSRSGRYSCWRRSFAIVECDLECAGDKHGYLLHRYQRSQSSAKTRCNGRVRKRRQYQQTNRGVLRGNTDGRRRRQAGRPSSGRALFSTSRSVASDRDELPARRRRLGQRINAAFAGALLQIVELQLGDFAVLGCEAQQAIEFRARPAIEEDAGCLRQGR